MSTMEPGFDYRQAASSEPEPGFPQELWSLLRTISHQIDEADQRHTGLLQDLRERLAALGRDAGDARGSAPAAAAPIYQRIELGLADLATRIDALDDGHSPSVPPFSSPVALRSASPEVGEVVEDRAVASGVDPFDVVGGDDEESAAWNTADAEALTRVYEESDAALVRKSPRQEAAADQPSLGVGTVEAPAAAEAEPLPIYSAASPSTFDQAWLDQRLADISLRIEQSLIALKSEVGVDRFGVRFEAFEERMNSVIGDVATRSDVQSLKVLESQIQDLAAHLEQTELQLGRLDGIEQQLAMVIEHLSTELEAVHHAAPEPAPVPDLKTLASSAAEEVAQRLSAAATARDDSRMDEIGSLMRSLIDDRRQSDEQTFTMLDTVQQAMIRLLDRMEAIELAQASAPPKASNAHSLVPPPIATVQAPVSEIQDFGAPDHFGETFSTAPPPLNAPAAPPAAAGPAEGLNIDKLRQDFIADAQRAKAAAAREQPAASATTAAPSSLRVQRGAPRPRSAPANPRPRSGPSRKQQLTAFALCIVIAVSGAALFLKSRTKAPASPNRAAVSETMPGSASGAVELPAVPGTGSALPLAGDGSGFEVPAEEGAGVPAPVPVDPRTGEGVDTAPAMGNETPKEPVSGGVIENGFSGSAPQAPNISAQGIILQSGGRQPTPDELANLQSQQNAAQLSSRLGTSASRLTPADLMPEEVAKLATASAAAGVTDLDSLRPQLASLSAASPMGEQNDGSAGETPKAVSQMSLPPATVGPLSLRLAAANGDPSAAFEVGARLAEGKGTNQDFHEAVIWYQKSASQGFAQAQYRLATLYERGLGLKKDLGRAQTWYQRAAEQGHVKAMHNLAVISAGRNSGNPDYMTAAQWFERAADFGLSDSQFNLAVLHENGLGLAKDPVEAYKWYSLAAQGGDKEALRRRDSLKAQLTADQRLQAERELSAFQPKRGVPLVNDPRVAGEDWKKRQQS